MARLASDILISAIIRLAEIKGGSATIERRGSQSSGAIFVTFYDSANKGYDVYEPVSQALAPQELLEHNRRYFALRSKAQDRVELANYFEKEARFDPDFWLVDVENVGVEALSDIIRVV
ncbi:MAG: DUF1491 family protein [Ahrensia sp.]|nr:DUF1491 family protein [Ahrensia sp.]